MGKRIRWLTPIGKRPFSKLCSTSTMITWSHSISQRCLSATTRETSLRQSMPTLRDPISTLLRKKRSKFTLSLTSAFSSLKTLVWLVLNCYLRIKLERVFNWKMTPSSNWLRTQRLLGRWWYQLVLSLLLTVLLRWLSDKTLVLILPWVLSKTSSRWSMRTTCNKPPGITRRSTEIMTP